MSMMKHHYHEQIAYPQEPWLDGDNAAQQFDDEYQRQESAPLAMQARILDLDFGYTREDRTDVTKTWIKHGWQRPDRTVQRRMFKKLNPSLA